MLKYYDPVQDGDKILSCDGVRISFVVSSEHSKSFEKFFSNLTRVDIRSWPVDTRDNHYKYLWNIDYYDNDEKDLSSLSCGYIFNSVNGESNRKGFLEFNPNKCAWSPLFFEDLKTIRSFSKSWDLQRVDIALDIPVRRDLVVLEKDNRVYESKVYSNLNKTEYLGLRSKPGRVKVYNKTLEQRLEKDLTRIEVTTEPNIESFFKHYPKVWDLTLSGQLTMDILSLSDTDLAILRLEIESLRKGNDDGLMIFNSMGRKKKQKLKPYLLPESALVLVSCSCVSSLLTKIQKDYGQLTL